MKRIAWLCLLLATGCVTVDEMGAHACPTDGTKHTYANFGEAFFGVHCVPCHGGPNGQSSRALNTLDAVRANKQRIFVNSAALNTAMPPGPDGPSQAERDKLAEWLVCGAP